MNRLGKARAIVLEVGEDGSSQRVDNFLIGRLKGVPRSHVYRILRTGEVRVNSARVQPDYRLRCGDRVRLPPLRTAARRARSEIPCRLPELPVAYEDEVLIALDKPPGVAAHGGSGVTVGAIEALRAARPQARFLALVHRLDRDTSGLLLVAKKRSALLALHGALREGRAQKLYYAVVRGRWQDGVRDIEAPLHTYVTARGERHVRVRAEGRRAHSRVRPVAVGAQASLVEVELFTGRTHQIRVHLAHVGHPVLGDTRYGDFALNRTLERQGVRRLLLHAARLVFAHPVSGARVEIESPLPSDMQACVHKLCTADAR